MAISELKIGHRDLPLGHLELHAKACGKGEAEMQTIDIQQFNSIRNATDDIAVINVLPRAIFEKDHIPDTRNVPLESSNFENDVEQILSGDRTRPVVVYCASEDCDASSKAARQLEQAGFTHVYDFEGGTKAWNEQAQHATAS